MCDGWVAAARSYDTGTIALSHYPKYAIPSTVAVSVGRKQGRKGRGWRPSVMELVDGRTKRLSFPVKPATPMPGWRCNTTLPAVHHDWQRAKTSACQPPGLFNPPPTDARPLRKLKFALHARAMTLPTCCSFWSQMTAAHVTVRCVMLDAGRCPASQATKGCMQDVMLVCFSIAVDNSATHT